MSTMATITDKLLSDALALPRDARAELATRLVRSLEDGSEDTAAADVSAEWVAEIDRRLSGLADGSIDITPMKDAIEDMRSALRQRRENRDR